MNHHSFSSSLFSGLWRTLGAHDHRALPHSNAYKGVALIIKILFAGLFVFTGAVSAQKSHKNTYKNASQHELSLTGGGGIGTLRYNPAAGSRHAGAGGNVGLGYAYFFTPQWGVSTGIGAAFYNSSAKIAAFDGSYLINTPAGLPDDSEFTLSYRYEGFKEKQKAAYLQIPVMAEYRTTGANIFYASAGVKIGVPLKARYATTLASYTTKGFSDYTGLDYENMPTHGFSTYKNEATSGSLKTRVAIFGALETGMKWQLADRWALYTGVYLDYGFNNIRKNDSAERLLQYNEASPTDYGYHSLIETDKVSKMNLWSVGIKVRVAMGL
jgi:hypothetical protein